MFWNLLFDTNRPVAFCLNLLIFALALTATSFALWTRFGTMRAELRDLERIHGLPVRSREAVAGAVAGSGTVVAQRVKDLGGVASSNYPVDAASLTALSTARFRSMLSYPAGIGRSLVVLGLFGTVMGLGLSVTALATNLVLVEEVDTARFLRAILDTLGGM